MRITEPARHRLYEKLEELLGMDDAATLMAHLPPEGWADVARRADLDQLRADLRLEMAELRSDIRHDIGAFRDELHRDRVAAQRQLLFVLVAAMVSVLVAVALAS